MSKHPHRALYLFLFLAAWMPASAPAQSNAGGGDINQLIDEVNVLLEKGERERLADRSFRKPFRGFQIVNRGGDYAIRQITVDGAT